MVQSILSRLAVFTALALIGVGLLFLFLGANKNSGETQSFAATAPTVQAENETLVEPGEAEVQPIQIASLSVITERPALEIIEIPSHQRPNTQSYIDLALEFTQEKRFNEALAALNNIHVSDRNNYAVKFLEARILSWSGQHDKAGQAFQKLRARHPEDLDVMVSFGFLRFYQKQYVEAEKLFVEVLNNNPDYLDAQRGLERSRASMTN